ncbi:hypothetical protein Slin15195_G103310 [Septoria linicola]|uniref:Uncharacterized protein n=1 Tax=Septoria linicola TaxID=215465 RepID=A0A9Q9B427_9PEZI|nr:hypothetical protein Slin14017_G066310 [Septoria linicola]USW57012.1 hypothetical protein Slin15195_G103310 [Septoria linicola]
MRLTAIISSVLALGALTSAAPVAFDASPVVANIVARAPEPSWGIVGKVLGKLFNKTQANSKANPAPSTTQNNLGLDADGRAVGWRNN